MSIVLRNRPPSNLPLRFRSPCDQRRQERCLSTGLLISPETTNSITALFTCNLEVLRHFRRRLGRLFGWRKRGGWVRTRETLSADLREFFFTNNAPDACATFPRASMVYPTRLFHKRIVFACFRSLFQSDHHHEPASKYVHGTRERENCWKNPRKMPDSRNPTTQL